MYCIVWVWGGPIPRFTLYNKKLSSDSQCMQDRSHVPLYSFSKICMGIYIWGVLEAYKVKQTACTELYWYKTSSSRKSLPYSYKYRQAGNFYCGNPQYSSISMDMYVRSIVNLPIFLTVNLPFALHHTYSRYSCILLHVQLYNQVHCTS